MLALILLALWAAVNALQIPLSASTGSQVLTPTSYRSIGPFPIGTRESALLPHQRSIHSQSYRSTLGVNGSVHWHDVKARRGRVIVNDTSIDWKSYRLISGWIALQHEVYYMTTIKPIRSSLYAFSLDGANDFTIRRKNLTSFYTGNIYMYDKAPPHLIHLVAREEIELAVRYVHDIRVAGEPSTNPPVPTGEWSMNVVQSVPSVELVAGASIVPDLVNGMVMGDVLGLEVRNTGLVIVWITAVKVDVQHDHIDVALLHPVKLAPLQSRRLRMQLVQNTPAVRGEKLQHRLPIKIGLASADGFALESLSASIHFLHSNSTPSNPIPFTSTFLSTSGTPSFAVYVPPRSSCPPASPISPPVILVLHGAGVDPKTAPELTGSLDPQKDGVWTVFAHGLTPWGVDWHGPTLTDALTSASHVEQVQRAWNRVWELELGVISTDRQKANLIVLGHSNGGQGAWYLSSHYPDRVVGVVPSSGYLKIQDYVPYSLSVGSHFRDSALTGILTSSLSQFDNDLYASNLVGLPILARHGDQDDNVPVTHSRLMVDLIEQWSIHSGDNSSLATYDEVKGAVHWFDSVFRNAQPFIDSLIDRYYADAQVFVNGFTLRTANPDESGSKNGIRIIELETPGRFAQIDVEIVDTLVHLRTKGLSSFLIDVTSFLEHAGVDLVDAAIAINSQPTLFSINESTLFFSQSPNRSTFLQTSFSDVSARRYGPLITILKTPRPLAIIYGTQQNSSRRHLQSIATRIASDVFLYIKVDSEIFSDAEWEATGKDRETEMGNFVLIGDGFSNSVISDHAESWKVPVRFTSPYSFSIKEETFEGPGTGLIFLAPSRIGNALSIVISGLGFDGLESAMRLFPVRTGVTVPDWAVTSPVPTDGGIVAAGFWSADWGWSDRASFL